jgi:hypothetical protein
VLSRFKANEEATVLVLAEVFMRHRAFALADGIVRTLGDNAPAAREKLLTLYRTRIDKKWPCQGNGLNWAPDGGLGISVGGEVTDLSPLKGMPLTSLNCHNTGVADLSPLEGMRLTELEFTPARITRGWTWFALCRRCRNSTTSHGRRSGIATRRGSSRSSIARLAGRASNGKASVAGASG